MRVKYLKTLLMCLLLSACANTKITENWLDHENSKSYLHPMIIGITDSQQTRQIYEKHFVAELAKKNITATPSYTLISSKQKINRETVSNAIKDTQIDSVLVSYLVSVDSKLTHYDSPINTGYSGDTDNMMSDTLVSKRGRASSTEVIELKNDLYDVKSKAIIWSVQTETVAPESIDQAIVDVTVVIIKQLFDDRVLK